MVPIDFGSGLMNWQGAGTLGSIPLALLYDEHPDINFQDGALKISDYGNALNLYVNGAGS